MQCLTKFKNMSVDWELDGPSHRLDSKRENNNKNKVEFQPCLKCLPMLFLLFNSLSAHQQDWLLESSASAVEAKKYILSQSDVISCPLGVLHASTVTCLEPVVNSTCSVREMPDHRPISVINHCNIYSLFFTFWSILVVGLKYIFQKCQGIVWNVIKTEWKTS